MGFDVYGNKPKSKKGEYFRNNVWWWHPLWGYCCETYPDICSKVKYGHSNDGDGLKSTNSKKLSLALKRDLDNGKVLLYQTKREEELKALPRIECTLCKGSGIRNDEYVQGECNACKGDGTVSHFETNYPFSVENVEEFQGFLEECGGFKIF